MVIAFICGSLEEGKDGVGDYVRRLSKELTQKGHKVFAISLYDQYISKLKIDVFSSGSLKNSIVRIPSKFSDQERFSHLRQYLVKFKVEWISLQFVPFSFHSKGLPFRLGFNLSRIGKEYSWHIMFHELWVGMDKNATIKMRLWGLLQKWIIKNILNKLNPHVIQTNVQLYEKHIKRLGYNSSLLPLFGNIPVNQKNRVSKVPTLLRDLSKTLSFVIFGSIHYGAPVEIFSKEVADYSIEKDIYATLILIGRCGPEKERWISAWKANNLNIINLGEQPVKIVSEVLLQASVGITTTPKFLVEKSGAVAAMKEHMLPVLCISRPWLPGNVADLQSPTDILEYQPGKLSQLLLLCKRKIYNGNTVLEIANQLIRRFS